MGLVFGHGPQVTDEDLEDWKFHLARMAPVLDLLEESGLSRGEALIVVELNSLSSHLCDIRKALFQEGYE